MDENPYQSPEICDPIRRRQPAKTKWHLGWLAGLILLCGMVSAIAFGPQIGLVPGDSRGPPIAFGLGGFVGLGIYFAIRVIVWLFDD